MTPADLQTLARAALVPVRTPSSYDAVQDALLDCENGANPLHELADIVADNIRADECRFAFEVMARFCKYPAPSIDADILAEILADMKSAAARLRGPRCEFSDKRAAAALDRARLDLIESLNLDL